MEEPDVLMALSLCHLNELDFSPMRTTYFLSREAVIPTKLIGMARWRESLFRVPGEECQQQPQVFQIATEPGVVTRNRFTEIALGGCLSFQ